MCAFRLHHGQAQDSSSIFVSYKSPAERVKLWLYYFPPDEADTCFAGSKYELKTVQTVSVDQLNWYCMWTADYSKALEPGMSSEQYELNGQVKHLVRVRDDGQTKSH